MNTDNHGEENSPFRRRRLPSLNALRCFEAAARLENFSRAAEALCLTHGAISRAVRTLEEELGCALFERRASGFSSARPAGACSPAPARPST